MLDYKNEISGKPPADAPARDYYCGTPLLYCFECALCEKETETGYDYYAINCNSGKRLRLTSRKYPMATNEDIKFAELVRRSAVAGASRYQIDRPAGQSVSLAKAKQLLRYIITVLLPQHGYDSTEEQAELGERLLDSIALQKKVLVEAGDGPGQSATCLAAMIVAKRGRLTDQANLSLYPEMQYADMFRLPSIISIPSAAKQNSVAHDLIPALSRILLEREMILTPLTIIHRKSRGRFVCLRNLNIQLSYWKDPETRKALETLLQQGASVDLDGAKDISLQVKKKICPPRCCDDNCRYRGSCQFITSRQNANSLDFDFQVCGHGYVFNYGQNRTMGQDTLLPNHQFVMASQTNFLENAIMAYSEGMSAQTAQHIMDLASQQKYHRKGTHNLTVTTATKLRNVSDKLFAALSLPETGYDSRDLVVMDDETIRQLNNTADIADRLIAILRSEVFFRKAEAVIAWARERYKANMSGVDIGRILADSGSSEVERKKQATMLHRAICGQPGVAVHIANEAKDRREPRFGINPERYALQREQSSVNDKIWRRIEKLMLSENTRCAGCEEFFDLIWLLGQLRDSASNLALVNECDYSLDSAGGETVLFAKPKDLPGRLNRDLWSRNIPIILMSEKPVSAGEIEITKSTLGLENR